ncbi:MFS transporter [uncultured Methanobrevibacter sp.]|uniref:MFS transporter n=1 Tax=uncultured Methanobrevibacter sp. TaxID=253161 RepID=UPI0025ED9BEF|nr:MFS transporter [uncultured Methanobrevibacter sp.]
MNLNFMKNDWKSQATIILIHAALMQLTMNFVANFINVILPDIAKDLNITIETLNLLSLFFLIAVITVLIPLSKYINQYGIKRCTRIIIIVLIGGLILSAITYSFELLLISRVIQGICIAILPTINYILIMLALPHSEAGKTLGIVSSCGYIGMTIAPSVTGFVAYYFSWRMTFLLMIPVLIFDLFLMNYIKEEWSVENKSIDYVGSILYGLIMILFILSVIDIQLINFVLFILTVIFIIIFIVYEKRIEYPVYNLNLMKNVKYIIGNFGGLVSYFIVFITTYTLSLYLQVILGLDSKTAGLFLLITPIAMVFVTPYAGKLADKYDPIIISGIGMTIITSSLVILTCIDILPEYMILVALILQGIGHGMFSPSNNKDILTSVQDKDLSDASALLNTGKEIGKIFGLAIFNFICIMLMDNSNLENNILGLSHSIHYTLVVGSILGGLSVISLIYSKYWIKS